MADAFVGYRLPLNDGDNAFSNKITRKGLRYGIHIKLNLPVILRRIFRRTADSPDRTETDEPADDDGAQPARYAW